MYECEEMLSIGLIIAQTSDAAAESYPPTRKHVLGRYVSFGVQERGLLGATVHQCSYESRRLLNGINSNQAGLG
jgi:hypothetical protein